MNTSPLQPPDSHHLSGAIGWLGLGNAAEANGELDQISPENQSHPSVMVVRFEIYSKAQRWSDAVGVANSLIQLEPNEPGLWIALAYATRRKEPGGGILSAKDILLPAQKRFPKEPILAYNLACYECQLGNREAALTWLEEAFKLGDPKQLKRMALEDADLEPLWKELGQAKS